MNRTPRPSRLALACALLTLVAAPAALAQNEPAAPGGAAPQGPATATEPAAGAPGLATGVNEPALRPYYFTASERLTHDSNIFRVNNNSGLGKDSDFISTTSVGAGFNQPIRRQRLYGAAGFDVTRYQDNDQLNGTGYNLLAGLAWEAGSKLSGDFSARAGRAQANFANYGDLTGNRQKNQEKSSSIDLRGQYGGRSLLTLEAFYNHTKLNYTADVFSTRDQRSDSFGGGLRVRPHGLWSYGVAYRYTDGKYDGFDDGITVVGPDDYTRHDIDLTANYTVTGRSAFNGRISYSRESHDLDSRDFDGITGELDYTYIYSGKLTLNAGLSRDTNSGNRTGTTLTQGAGGGITQRPVESVSFLNDSSRSTTLTAGALWRPAAKVSVEARASYAHEKFDNSFVSEAGEGSGGSTGNSQLYSLAATYAGGRIWSVGCGVSYETRHTNVRLSTGKYSFSANQVFCNGTLRFQ